MKDNEFLFFNKIYKIKGWRKYKEATLKDGVIRPEFYKLQIQAPNHYDFYINIKEYKSGEFSPWLVIFNEKFVDDRVYYLFYKFHNKPLHTPFLTLNSVKEAVVSFLLKFDKIKAFI